MLHEGVFNGERPPEVSFRLVSLSSTFRPNYPLSCLRKNKVNKVYTL